MSAKRKPPDAFKPTLVYDERGRALRGTSGRSQLLAVQIAAGRVQALSSCDREPEVLLILAIIGRAVMDLADHDEAIAADARMFFRDDSFAGSAYMGAVGIEPAFAREALYRTVPREMARELPRKERAA